MGTEVAGAIDIKMAGTSKAEVAEMLDVKIGMLAKLVVPRKRQRGK